MPRNDIIPPVMGRFYFLFCTVLSHLASSTLAKLCFHPFRCVCSLSTQTGVSFSHHYYLITRRNQFISEPVELQAVGRRVVGEHNWIFKIYGTKGSADQSIAVNGAIGVWAGAF